MPLEIRELVIKASVNEGQQRQNSARESGNFDADTQAAIIATCVEQVLAILKEKSER
ncbi:MULTISPECIES: DUF5908 family protein [Calothrix]|uniref:Uncharacterized protein n=2 Tax=Calothrix TaxID=1186 RepID=A0ABR8AL74_9CYAN|nr:MULTISPECIES: DUF5908 family protein [Calothrix]MBD2199387.1 hypothetical protein [Calothrix parietina FACHB-288]MBD2228073.1 hypothetical protein [Calothrix anomala FACHB-343]